MKTRPIRIEGDIAYVPLTKGYEAVIDARDAPLVCKWNWCAFVSPHAVYAIRTDHSGKKKRTVRMHRFLMGVLDDEGVLVDHRNGNGLDNRRSSNLRTATPSQNAQNRCLHNGSASGFKGVTWHKSTKRWAARIGLSGKRRTLGYYSTPELAHSARVEAAAKLHGEFARAE